MNNLVEIIKHKAQQTPDKLAYIFLRDGETLETKITYQQLFSQSLFLAQKLREKIPTQSRVLLLYPQGLEFVTAFLGCLIAEIIAVPVYPPKGNQKMSRLEAIIEDCQPSLILTTHFLLAKVEDKLGNIIKEKNIECIATDNLEETKEIQSINLDSFTGDKVAFLQYTSGSTGIPKGVMISHQNILANSAYIQKAFQLTEDSVSVTWLPSFHDMGLIDGILQPLYTGFLGVIMSPEAFLQKPIRWLEAISRYHATHSGSPNLGYELCVQKITDEQKKDLDLSCWVSAYNGSEPVRFSTIENFTNKFKACGFESRYFYPCYGMAEATLMISGGDLEKESVYLDVDGNKLRENLLIKADNKTKNIRRLVGCGHSWLDTEIKIVNSETNIACEDNQIGEIWVSGSSIAQGYWQKPEISQEVFKANLILSNPSLKGGNKIISPEFLRTGDLGFIHDGELFITGRQKDLIIIWGKNHYPQDIEVTVQNSHQALRGDSGAAFSVDIEIGEKLVIVQEVRRSYIKQLDIDEIITAIREAVSLEHELQVYAIALIKPASIPKTSSGKIQRYACRQQFLGGNLNLIGEWQQKSILTESMIEDNLEINEENISNWLIAKLADVLGLEKEELDTETSFSSYGLDSSVALTLTGELGEWLEIELEATLFWEYTDIKELTEYLWEEWQNEQN
jgi:acyl-CoA synthetase (AMP-forming)/AMP-acid ligase II/acyl carrier protein